jgi:hypothetical protein
VRSIAGSSLPDESTKDGLGPSTSVRVRSAFARLKETAAA